MAHTVVETMSDASGSMFPPEWGAMPNDDAPAAERGAYTQLWHAASSHAFSCQFEAAVSVQLVMTDSGPVPG